MRPDHYRCMQLFPLRFFIYDHIPRYETVHFCLFSTYMCSVIFVSHGDTLQILSTIFQRMGAGKHRSMKHLETAVPRELGEWDEGMRKVE